MFLGRAASILFTCYFMVGFGTFGCNLRYLTFSWRNSGLFGEPDDSFIAKLDSMNVNLFCCQKWIIEELLYWKWFQTSKVFFTCWNLTMFWFPSPAFEGSRFVNTSTGILACCWTVLKHWFTGCWWVQMAVLRVPGEPGGCRQQCDNSP